VRGKERGKLESFELDPTVRTERKLCWELYFRILTYFFPKLISFFWEAWLPTGKIWWRQIAVEMPAVDKQTNATDQCASQCFSYKFSQQQTSVETICFANTTGAHENMNTKFDASAKEVYHPRHQCLRHAILWWNATGIRHGHKQHLQAFIFDANWHKTPPPNIAWNRSATRSSSRVSQNVSLVNNYPHHANPSVVCMPHLHYAP